MKRLRRLWVLVMACVGMGVLGACGVINPQPSATPIYVTATPRVVVVTATATPRATDVLAPTLPPDEVAALNTLSAPTMTATTAITLTPTFTPTPTNTPPTPGSNAFVPVGGMSSGGQVVVSGGACFSLPSGGFATVYNGNPSLAGQISCPIDQAMSISTAYQSFERGFMVWVSQVGSSGQGSIYVFYHNNTYQRFLDTWRDGVDPSSVGRTPPTGLQEPIRGFGKVWRESGGVEAQLGWAIGSESGGGGVIQVFERGEMLYLSMNGQTYIMVAGTPGTWSSVAVPY